MKTLMMTLLTLALCAAVPLSATGCAGGMAAALQSASVVFDSVAKGLSLIQTIRMWLKSFGSALAPATSEALHKTLDEAERFLLHSRQLAQQGQKTLEQAEQTKQQGMALLQQAWDTLKQSGIARASTLVGGMARSGEPVELRVELPPEIK